MKTLFLTIALAFAFTMCVLNAQSQDSDNGNDKNSNNQKNKVWFGLRAGTDLATPTFDTDEIESQLKSNYQFGVYARIGKKLFSQPEVYYAVKNEKIFYGQNTMDEVMVNSLKVPVLLGIELIDLGVVSAHVMAGPMGTMFLSQSSSDYIIEHPKYEYKLQLGGGIDVLKFVTLDVRYSVNLNDNIKEELNHLSFKSGINVTLGIQFR
jgi:hypothetical protein